MLQTSGLLLTENKDGSIIVEYEDYGTPMGGDFSSIYNLDADNATKLKKAMKQRHPLLSFKKALIREVGKNLNDEKRICSPKQLVYMIVMENLPGR